RGLSATRAPAASPAPRSRARPPPGCSGRPRRPWCPAGSSRERLLDPVVTARLEVLELLHEARRPADLERVDLLVLAEAHQHAPVALAAETRARHHDPALYVRAEAHEQLGAVRIEVARPSEQVEADPAVLVRAFVAVVQQRPVLVRHHEIGRAVVVEV